MGYPATERVRGLPEYKAAVEAGERVGYGALMAAAEVAWGDALERDHGTSRGGAHSVGPCVALLVPCPCAGTKASPCDWCCGSHRVTKRVREAMEDRGQKLLDACAVLDEHDCVARIDLIDERKVSGRLGVGVKCKVETLSDAILWLAEHEEEA